MAPPTRKVRATGLSVEQYARSRKRRGLPGGTENSVRKAVESGRVTVNKHGRIVDEKEADREWEANRQRPTVAPKGARPPAGAAPAPSVNGKGKIPPIGQSKAAIAAVDLKLKRLLLAKERAEVVDRKLLQDHARRAAQVIQRHALTFHSRVAAPVHGAPDVRAAERILEREMRQFLELVVRELETLERGRGT